MTAQQTPAMAPDWCATATSLPEIWDTLQRIQTEFSYRQELPAYYTNRRFLNAERVLDLGCGNGSYLRRIAERFPDKRYVGMDADAGYISSACATADPNMRFECCDLFDARGEYDFVIVRLVLQHLDQPAVALRRLRALIRPGGGALVIDALDEARRFEPQPARFLEFFEAYKKHQLSIGRNRDAACNLAALLHDVAGLQPQRVDRIVIPSTLPGNLALFEQTYYLMIAMTELTGALPWDYATVKRDWLRWCRQPQRYLQVGLTLAHLSRD